MSPVEAIYYEDAVPAVWESFMVLIAHTLSGCDQTSRSTVETLRGRPDLGSDDVEELRAVIRASGAIEVGEQDIARLTGFARDAPVAAGSLDAESGDSPAALVDLATARWL